MTTEEKVKRIAWIVVEEKGDDRRVRAGWPLPRPKRRRKWASKWVAVVVVALAIAVVGLVVLLAFQSVPALGAVLVQMLASAV